MIAVATEQQGVYRLYYYSSSYHSSCRAIINSVVRR